MNRLVLASQSPRRRELLALLGHPFTVRPADADETMLPGEIPDVHVRRLAELKASTVGESLKESIVIGSDTIVVIDGDILGKPVSREDAFGMLERLSNRTHEVYTGFALYETGTRRMVSGHEITAVTMRDIPGYLIERYLDTGESFDKAGAYGIQGYGAALIRGVEGCYFNVMGLPLARLMETLDTFSGGQFGYFGIRGDKGP
jgi:septum formation protein